MTREIHFIKNIAISIITIIIMTVQASYAQSEDINSYDSTLIKVFADDQNIRLKIDSLVKLGINDLDILIPAYLEMNQVDLDNQKIAFPILDKYLNKEITLSEASLSALYYVIQHSEGEAQKKYEPFIVELYKQKAISKTEYMWFVDRLSLKFNKAQTFGVQAYMNGHIQDRFLYPISISSQANRLRKKLNIKINKEELASTYKGAYNPVYLKKSEYGIFGHVLNKSNKAVANVKVIIDGKEVSRTNDNGFYKIKLKKDNLPHTIHFKHNETEYDQTIDYKPNTDWQTVNYQHILD